MTQRNKNKSTSKKEEQAIDEQPAKVETPAADKTDEVIEDIDKVLADQAIDDLLDEMDEVLEENAAEFVHAFVQKGGE